MQFLYDTFQKTKSCNSHLVSRKIEQLTSINFKKWTINFNSPWNYQKIVSFWWFTEEILTGKLYFLCSVGYQKPCALMQIFVILFNTCACSSLNRLFSIDIGKLKFTFLNPLLCNVVKWSDTLYLATFAVRFLKCVWPFYGIAK